MIDEIQVTFNTGNKEYKVIRGIKLNVFEIYCNDVLINQDASNIDYQNTLEQQILKCNLCILFNWSHWMSPLRLTFMHSEQDIEERLLKRY